jgi:oligopeptide/dipeptide ABC transporter ATP-binding protein
MTKPLLQIRNVSKTFSSGKNTTDVLKNLSLSIESGEIFALVGESGSGKSTLGKLIVKLFSPTSGDILFEGRSIVPIKKQELLSYRKKVHMIFQDPQFCLDPHMSILDIVEEPLIIHSSLGKKERKEAIVQLFEELSLPLSLLQKHPHELSGGQNQRIGIARALIAHPTFLILDEPTSSLDLPTTGQIISLLLDIHQKKNLSSLLITHDLLLAKKIATKIGVLYRGHLVEVAPSHQLFEHPRHPYTRLLLSSFRTMGDLHERKEAVLEKKGSCNCPFFPRCSSASHLCTGTAPSFRKIGDSHFVLCHKETKSPPPTQKVSTK